MRVGPILMQAEMVRALLNGRKTITRRVMKPQPDFLYSITGDIISAVHINMRAVDEINQTIKRHRIAPDSNIAELGLHGGFRWQCVLADTLQRLRAQGVCGLVSVSRSQKQQGQAIFNCIVMPQKQESNQACSSSNLHGLSRDAAISHGAGSPLPGLEPAQLQTGQSEMGYADRKLARPERARARMRRGEAPRIEVEQCGEGAYSMGPESGAMQPKTYSSRSWDEPTCHLERSPYEIGQLRYVRESWALRLDQDHITPRDLPVKHRNCVGYWADGPGKCCNTGCAGAAGRVRASMHMPRWASRLTLRLKEVRVERVQEISEEDAKAEGTINACPETFAPTHRAAFENLWGHINAKRGYGWDANPWVWVLVFDVIKNNVDEHLKEAT